MAVRKAKAKAKAAGKKSKILSSSSLSSSSSSTGQTFDSLNSNFNSTNSTISSPLEKLIIYCTISKTQRPSKKFFCPRPGCSSHFSTLFSLMMHDRKHRKMQAYRCLFHDPLTGHLCHQRASILGNLMTHVHKRHFKHTKYQYGYLKKFIEEDQQLLEEEKALFAGAELRWNAEKGGEEDLIEDSIENSVENPVEDFLKTIEENEKNSVIIANDSKKKEDSENLDDDTEEEEEVLFTEAELKMNVRKGGKENLVEDLIEDFVEKPVEDSLKKKEEKKKNSIIINDNSKKEKDPENLDNKGEEEEEEEEEEDGEDDGSYAYLLAKYHRLEQKYPFPCRLGRFENYSFCEFRFAKESDRFDHEREHLGVRPFQCLWPNKNNDNDEEKKKDFCGRHFLRRQFAREHIKNEHGFEVGDLDEELDQFINVQEDLLLA